jgi:hypothetical protein
MFLFTGKGKVFDDICSNRDSYNRCFVMGVLQFFSGNRTYYDETVSTISDLRSAVSKLQFPDGTRVNRDLIFGKYTVNETTDELITVI